MCNRRCGFGDLACDSVREGRAGGHQPLVAVRASTVAVSIETIRKYRIETVSCSETSITNACYLCITLRKTGGHRSLEAVPVLRVQKSSVIVIERRRGASRGRPVLGGSLKSLAFMRECPSNVASSSFTVNRHGAKIPVKSGSQSRNRTAPAVPSRLKPCYGWGLVWGPRHGRSFDSTAS